VTTRSDDFFGYGLCKWENKCFKDADSDDQQDETGKSDKKKTDFYPPRTNFLPLEKHYLENTNYKTEPVMKDQNGFYVTNGLDLVFFASDQVPAGDGFDDCESDPRGFLLRPQGYADKPHSLRTTIGLSEHRLL